MSMIKVDSWNILNVRMLDHILPQKLFYIFIKPRFLKNKSIIDLCKNMNKHKHNLKISSNLYKKVHNKVM